MVFKSSRKSLLQHYGAVVGLGAAVAATTLYLGVFRPIKRHYYPSEPAVAPNKEA